MNSKLCMLITLLSTCTVFADTHDPKLTSHINASMEMCANIAHGLRYDPECKKKFGDSVAKLGEVQIKYLFNGNKAEYNKQANEAIDTSLANLGSDNICDRLIRLYLLSCKAGLKSEVDALEEQE